MESKDFTSKQIKERENLEWFAPSLERFGPKSDEVFREYLNHSERGIEIKSAFNFYKEAKRLRGITIHELWEDSFYGKAGGWVGLYTLLQEEDGSPIPKHIMEYIASEIFAGQDKEKIENIYKEIESDFFREP